MHIRSARLTGRYRSLPQVITIGPPGYVPSRLRLKFVLFGQILSEAIASSVEIDWDGDLLNATATTEEEGHD